MTKERAIEILQEYHNNPTGRPTNTPMMYGFIEKRMIFDPKRGEAFYDWCISGVKIHDPKIIEAIELLYGQI